VGRRFVTFPGVPVPGHQEVLRWGQRHFPTQCFLNGNGFSGDPYSGFHQAYALGAARIFSGNGTDSLSGLRAFCDQTRDWLFGFLSYELKNELENLTSGHDDGIGMPVIHFFQPVVLVIADKRGLHIGCLPGYGEFSEPEAVYRELCGPPQAVKEDGPAPGGSAGFTEAGNQDGERAGPYRASIRLQARVSKERYLECVRAIRQHIQQGDIYEMNYCVEFHAGDAAIDPLTTYCRLNAQSPTPFSCYLALGDRFLMCASPERFLRKQGRTLVSQPIKGTIARGSDPQSDARLAEQLHRDPKERSENVMIVDLVRNDLSRTARRGSVGVPELYGIYPFRQVYQMISTVTAELGHGFHAVDAIRHAFPMGSMTGAPKIRAMQLIETYENRKRGLFSGAVGYFNPSMDFDFNVVIRSIQYNRKSSYLSMMAGSAITIGSDPEREYEECLLKASAMMKALGGVLA